MAYRSLPLSYARIHLHTLLVELQRSHAPLSKAGCYFSPLPLHQCFGGDLSGPFCGNGHGPPRRESAAQRVLDHAQESNANPGGCWKTFARDRSLASLDQKLIIPVWVDDAATGNHWILGEGLKDDERPLIEDIIVNFRHVSRPVNE